MSGIVAFKCESVATLDPVTFDTPESFVALSKWSAKKAGSISFDFRTTEPNGLMLFSHGKPRQQQRKDPRTPPTLKVRRHMLTKHTLDVSQYAYYCASHSHAPSAFSKHVLLITFL